MSDDLPRLPPRDPEGHKGTFGTVCVIGGQAASPRVMIGGPAFAAAAALRSGAGLAVLAVPAPIMTAALAIEPGATGLALPVDRGRRLHPSDTARMLDGFLPQYRCLAIGPGWGSERPQQQILVRLVARGEPPMVIDADGLNALSLIRDFPAEIRGPVILTPHPGEYRRLATPLGLDPDPESDAARREAATRLAQRLGCVVVLKGPRTVISDGQRTAGNETGNPALATAGTGDVLTGVIAGLVAQFFMPPGDPEGSLTLFDCARLGAHLHGLAADAWAARHGTAGLSAGDLAAEIPDAMARLRAR